MFRIYILRNPISLYNIQISCYHKRLWIVQFFFFFQRKNYNIILHKPQKYLIKFISFRVGFALSLLNKIQYHQILVLLTSSDIVSVWCAQCDIRYVFIIFEAVVELIDHDQKWVNFENCLLTLGPSRRARGFIMTCVLPNCLRFLR